LVPARGAVATFNQRDVPALVDMTTDDFQWVDVDRDREEALEAAGRPSSASDE
jgi:ketosteroid isomerase-like protein